MAFEFKYRIPEYSMEEETTVYIKSFLKYIAMNSTPVIVTLTRNTFYYDFDTDYFRLSITDDKAEIRNVFDFEFLEYNTIHESKILDSGIAPMKYYKFPIEPKTVRIHMEDENNFVFLMKSTHTNTIQGLLRLTIVDEKKVTIKRIRDLDLYVQRDIISSLVNKDVSHYKTLEEASSLWGHSPQRIESFVRAGRIESIILAEYILVDFYHDRNKFMCTL